LHGPALEHGRYRPHAAAARQGQFCSKLGILRIN
jgi:hypothetical protein